MATSISDITGQISVELGQATGIPIYQQTATSANQQRATFDTNVQAQFEGFAQVHEQDTWSDSSSSRAFQRILGSFRAANHPRRRDNGTKANLPHTRPVLLAETSNEQVDDDEPPGLMTDDGSSEEAR